MHISTGALLLINSLFQIVLPFLWVNCIVVAQSIIKGFWTVKHFLFLTLWDVGFSMIL